MPSQGSISVEEAISTAFSAGFSLNIDREKMAFLIGVYIYSTPDSTHLLSHAELESIYSRVNTLVNGEDETTSVRGNNAIVSLREQGLLSKLVVQGDVQYCLSSLGKAVGEHWVQSEALTSESLVLYTAHVRVILDAVLEAAGEEGDHWKEKVTLVLREIVGDIISSIDRRQQGMVRSQERIEKEIQGKISASWTDAIAVCEEMLRTTGDALDELHHVMLHETESILNVLEEIADLAMAAEEHDALEAVEATRLQMEAIRQWSNASHEEWSSYYREVHQFIRTQVRTDPNRNFSLRLTEAIRSYGDGPWRLRVLERSPYLSLNEGEFSTPVVPVKIETGAARPEVKPSALEDTSLLDAIRAEVAEGLEAKGRASLTAIAGRHMPQLGASELYRFIGDLVVILAESGSPGDAAGREWKLLDATVEVQDFTIVRTNMTEKDSANV